MLQKITLKTKVFMNGLVGGLIYEKVSGQQKFQVFFRFECRNIAHEIMRQKATVKPSFRGSHSPYVEICLSGTYK